MAGQPILGDFGIEFPLTVVAPKTRGTSRVWYKPNHRSFGAFMKSEQMRDVTVEVSEDIALLAREFTPKGTEPRDGSDGRDPTPLRDNFKVKREAGLLKVGGNLRVKVDVFNDSEHAAAVEFGLSRSNRIGTGGRRMLLRAGAQFGDVKLENEVGA